MKDRINIWKSRQREQSVLINIVFHSLCSCFDHVMYSNCTNQHKSNLMEVSAFSSFDCELLSNYLKHVNSNVRLVDNCAFQTNKDDFLSFSIKWNKKTCCELSAAIFNCALNTQQIACCQHMKKHDGDYVKIIPSMRPAKIG